MNFYRQFSVPRDNIQREKGWWHVRCTLPKRLKEASFQVCVRGRWCIVGMLVKGKKASVSFYLPAKIRTPNAMLICLFAESEE